MLNGVGVDGYDTSWSGPLVVNLVDVLVQFRMMEEPAQKRRMSHNCSIKYIYRRTGWAATLLQQYCHAKTLYRLIDIIIYLVFSTV